VDVTADRPEDDDYGVRRTVPRYRDRVDAGRHLATELAGLAGTPDLLVLGLPRGGLPVAAEVAGALGAPLDALAVRKLGVPGHEEFAMGAIASGGARVIRGDVVDRLGLDPATVERVIVREQAELERRERAYRGDRPFPAVAGRTVVLVDDGLATGATMEAAVRAVRTGEPARVIVAVPVAPPDTIDRLAILADEIVCPRRPYDFFAVGQWYDDFRPTSDATVAAILARADSRDDPAHP
jgi:predicted phosphoribosyltransferase